MRRENRIPDLDDPRYLHEVGWFLYQRKHCDAYQGGGYEAYREEHSRLLKDDILRYLGQAEEWLRDKTVVAVGSGCACELREWPAALKVEIDPLLYVYQQVNMLLPDREDAPPTMRVAVGIEDSPLLDEFADVVVCRNALDHMRNPADGLSEIWRILKPNGWLYISVDLGGVGTPDEPSPFEEGKIEGMLAGRFDIVRRSDGHKPHAFWRDSNSRFLLRKMGRAGRSVDLEEVTQAYERSIEKR